MIPTMGRRDAAYDCVSDLIHDDFFGYGNIVRERLFGQLKQLSRRVGGDTAKIITSLSSANTVARENAFLRFAKLIDAGADALQSFLAFENNLFLDDSVKQDDGFSPVATGTELQSKEEEMTETEQTLIQQLRRFFDRVDPRVRRYREYVTKSFDGKNAQRYSSSYEFYLSSFRDEIVAAKESKSENNGK